MTIRIIENAIEVEPRTTPIYDATRKDWLMHSLKNPNPPFRFQKKDPVSNYSKDPGRSGTGPGGHSVPGSTGSNKASNSSKTSGSERSATGSENTGSENSNSEKPTDSESTGSVSEGGLGVNNSNESSLSGVSASSRRPEDLSVPEANLPGPVLPASSEELTLVQNSEPNLVRSDTPSVESNIGSTEGFSESNKNKNNVLYNFEVLKHIYPDSDIPDKQNLEYLPYDRLSDKYEEMSARLKMHSTVQTYTRTLIGGFVLIEKATGMTGYTQFQAELLPMYRTYLYKLYKKPLLRAFTNLPDEIQFFLAIGLNSLIFYVCKNILKDESMAKVLSSFFGYKEPEDKNSNNEN